ncbi:hypothetical protein [Alteromonas halophila]|uniref:Flavodoxin n=1 Tax=Alteromonas halophila TaxID=516698 RepID=A0A918MZX5_9ALTE|nr:hypothetical protein [Alteromonas halophila]GGW87708.1 hypothetical protein GCM10007391_21790 [Alteromonas halophila]
MTTSVAVIYQDSECPDNGITHEVIRGLASEQIDVKAYSFDTAQSHLDELDTFDGMIFGSLPAKYADQEALQAFIRSTRVRCQTGVWRNKIATAFTHTLEVCAESMPSLLQLSLFCARHHMVWIDESDNTRTAAHSDVRTEDDASVQQTPAFAYGQRVALITKQWLE